VKEILLPGEQARKNEARQIKDGVEIDQPTWATLLKLAKELGAESPRSL
jgi:LDH2 family malate/lactate/ureidoglycolate dehydrogenase